MAFIRFDYYLVKASLRNIKQKKEKNAAQSTERAQNGDASEQTVSVCCRLLIVARVKGKKGQLKGLCLNVAWHEANSNRPLTSTYNSCA